MAHKNTSTLNPTWQRLGKVLGGGFPLAAFGGKKEIMQNISPVGKVYQAGTFSGNPVSATAGYTILNYSKPKERAKSIPNSKRTPPNSKKHLTDLSATIQAASPSLQHRFTLPNLLHQRASNRLRLRQTLRRSNVHCLLPRPAQSKACLFRHHSMKPALYQPHIPKTT